MNIQAINSQNFGEKFRLPVKSIMIGTSSLGPEYWATKRVNMVREYSNPNAKALYKQAQKTKDLKEKARLYSEMGEYTLIDLSLEARFERLINKVMDIIM